MKTFAASIAVWCALALAGLQVAVPTRLLYWSGVALVVFWIVFASVWLFRQPQREPVSGSLPVAEDGPEHGADQDQQNDNEGKSKRHGQARG